MPEYVLTENGNIKVKDGKPLVKDGEEEYAIDAIGAQERISALNSENKDYRKKASERKTKLEAFGDIDPVKAKQALETVDSMSQEHKVELENLRKTINDTWETKFNEKDTEISDLKGKLYDTNVLAKFATSPIVKDTVLPPDIAAQYFKQHFREDGTAVDSNGNVIYSKEQPGTPANFDEALSAIIDMYPNKDSILKSSGANGSGGHQSGNAGGSVLANYYDPNSSEFSRTEQAKVANKNPKLHEELVKTAPKKAN